MPPNALFSLAPLRVEMRRLGRRAPVRLSLPLPPPGHLLYVEVEGLGRAPSEMPARWRTEAGRAIARAPRRFLGGPVRVSIFFADKGQCDLESRARAILDLLVLRRIVENDCRQIVRELVLGWSGTEGCQVLVESLARIKAP